MMHSRLKLQTSWIILVAVIMASTSSPAPAEPQSPAPTDSSKVTLSKSKSTQKKSSSPAEEADIPKATVAPPKLGMAAPEKPIFRCQRKIYYRGKILDCDSHHLQDGERLRSIVSGVPDAVKSLDTYQSNARKTQNVAYIATAGIAVAAIGWFMRDLFFDPNGHEQIIFRNTLGLIGLGAAAGSVTYGFIFLRKNEENLVKAIELYNQAKPEDIIELRVTTDFELF